MKSVASDRPLLVQVKHGEEITVKGGGLVIEGAGLGWRCQEDQKVIHDKDILRAGDPELGKVGAGGAEGREAVLEDDITTSEAPHREAGLIGLTIADNDNKVEVTDSIADDIFTDQLLPQSFEVVTNLDISLDWIIHNLLMSINNIPNLCEIQ